MCPFRSCTYFMLSYFLLYGAALFNQIPEILSSGVTVADSGSLMTAHLSCHQWALSQAHPALEQVNRPVILRWLGTWRKLFPKLSPKINKHHSWRGSEKHTSLDHQNWVFPVMSGTRIPGPQSQDGIHCLFIDETGIGVHSIAKHHGPRAKIP